MTSEKVGKGLEPRFCLERVTKGVERIMESRGPILEGTWEKNQPNKTNQLVKYLSCYLGWWSLYQGKLCRCRWSCYIFVMSINSVEQINHLFMVILALREPLLHVPVESHIGKYQQTLTVNCWYLENPIATKSDQPYSRETEWSYFQGSQSKPTWNNLAVESESSPLKLLTV